MKRKYNFDFLKNISKQVIFRVISLSLSISILNFIKSRYPKKINRFSPPGRENFDSFDQAIKSLFVLDVSSTTSLADVAFWLDRSPKSSILQISSYTTNIDKYNALVIRFIYWFICRWKFQSWRFFLAGKRKYL